MGFPKGKLSRQNTANANGFAQSVGSVYERTELEGSQKKPEKLAMGRTTTIQWCHDTVNPIAGCDGWPLWPSVADLEAGTVTAVLSRNSAWSRAEVKKSVVTESVQDSEDEGRGAAVELTATRDNFLFHAV